jgi:hypothetical protein
MAVVVYTPDEIMEHGLRMMSYDVAKQAKVCRDTNLKRFREMYGSLPVVYAHLWEDLQTTRIAEATLVVDSPEKQLLYFLHAVHFLKKYPTEGDSAARFGKSSRTLRETKWAYVLRIQALKAQKISWPDEWTRNGAEAADIPTFLVTVDGVHCRIYEPQEGEWSKNPKYYSHKFKQAGLSYEIALSVFTNRVVSLNGPYPAATNDTAIFKNRIRGMIPTGKKAIVDNGYKGKDPKYAKPSPLDSAELRKFKGRARSRQECFNARMKNFGCLKQDFRHGVDRHRNCFEAIAVVCQYQLENGSPLFDV